MTREEIALREWQLSGDELTIRFTRPYRDGTDAECVAKAVRAFVEALAKPGADVPEGWRPTDEQIKHMVSRFLDWRLPENFNPDCGISFTPEHSVEFMASRGKPPRRFEPVGTNLFDATQAEAMVRYMVEGLPGSEVRDAR